MEVFNLNQQISKILIEFLISKGVGQYFVAPGLRNAPLISTVNELTKNIFSNVDERSLGYNALGYSKINNSPSALLCTSGTALLNFAPAIAEAYKSNIPLIVISADRPRELIEINSNQTILQQGTLSNFVCEEVHIEVSPHECGQEELLQKLKIISDGLKYNKPVHINISFDEPLDSTKGILLEIDSTKFFIENVENKNQSPELTEINELIKISERPILLFGGTEYFKGEQSITKTLERIKCPVYLDISSGLKKCATPNGKLLPSLDHPESREFINKYRPDLVVVVGNYFITKHLTNIKCLNHDSKVVYFSDNDLTQKVFSRQPSKRLPFKSFNNIELENLKSWDIATDFNKINSAKRNKINEYGLTFPFISKTYLDSKLNQKIAYLGNSTIIRSFDYYIPYERSEPQTVLTHRGVSGIEGFLSAAIGATINNNGEIDLFIGDVSFIHDINALFSLNKAKKIIRVFLLNNSGGGIFKNLPLKGMESSINLMTTPHQFNFEGTCKDAGINYQKVKTKEQFIKVVNEKTVHHTVFECIIDQEENLELFKVLQTIDY